MIGRGPPGAPPHPVYRSPGRVRRDARTAPATAVPGPRLALPHMVGLRAVRLVVGRIPRPGATSVSWLWIGLQQGPRRRGDRRPIGTPLALGSTMLSGALGGQGRDAGGGERAGGRDVPDGLERASAVEPVHPFEGGELDGFEGSPRPAATDELGLDEADHGLGEGIKGWTPPAPPPSIPGVVIRRAERTWTCWRSTDAPGRAGLSQRGCPSGRAVRRTPLTRPVRPASHG